VTAATADAPKPKGNIPIFVILALLAVGLPFLGKGGIVAGVVIGAAVLGVPLFGIIGLLTVTAFVVYLGADQPNEFPLIERSRGLGDNPTLLAVPLFIMSGAVMGRGEISSRLIGFARACIGWIPGGVGMSAVFACVFFAAISGSSPATVVAIGAMMAPTLIEAGYGERFTHGLLSSAGSLGILIPPSIPMILYPIVNQTAVIQVETLFASGFGPGGVMAVIFAGACYVVGVLKNRKEGKPLGPDLYRGALAVAAIGVFYPFLDGVLGAIEVAVKFAVYLVVIQKTTDFEISEVLKASGRGFWALIFPVAILGGIYGGIYIAVEAAAFSVVYAVLVEVFIHRALTMKDVMAVFRETGVFLGALLVIMVAALSFEEFLEQKDVPHALVQWIEAMNLEPWQFLLMINGVLLLVGMAMDILSAMFVFVPLLAPIANAMGIDPIHFGIIFIVNLEIGYLTPPVGLNLFVASTLFERPLGHLIKSVAPFIAMMLVGLGLITYIPGLSVGLGRRIMGEEPPEEFEPFDPGGGAIDEPADEPGDVQSLDEMMQEAGDGEGGVQSLEEMMQEAAGDDEGGVQSLEEMMQEADEVEADDSGGDDGEVQSLEEMMQEAGI
jgi:C4-dicarboxylate transporter DctM subunit